MNQTHYRITLTFDPTNARSCPSCGEKMTFELCRNCAGTGAISRHIPGRERCPIRIDDCPDCEGQGGHWICPNAQNHPNPIPCP